ncbi:hypothetical protein M9H77_09472 [Catharanthus roseus]|uniref:Uncharacterized protein n=1 Tax=Catharanthus roseus TaxID=4058 RepID=A0ACC0C114_CATRO|nr:hypothetical protein M9H77_09472 [Catharanthus roseus]
MRKVQTIIRRCMLSIGGFDIPQDPFDSLDVDAPAFSLYLKPPAQSHPSGAGTLYIPRPSTEGTSYAHLVAVGCSFDVPPLSGTAGSSIPHMPISRASSSNLDEQADEPTIDVTPIQQIRFGHRIDKKATRFTASDWRWGLGYEYIRIKKKAIYGHREITRFTKEHAYLVQFHQNKYRNMTSKFISKLISHLVANDPEIPVSNIIQKVQVLLQMGCTYKSACCGKWQNIYCLVLILLQSVVIMVQDEMFIYRIYIQGKLIEKHVNPIFIQLGTRTFGEMLLTI